MDTADFVLVDLVVHVEWHHLFQLIYTRLLKNKITKDTCSMTLWTTLLTCGHSDDTD